MWPNFPKILAGILSNLTETPITVIFLHQGLLETQQETFTLLDSTVVVRYVVVTNVTLK